MSTGRLKFPAGEPPNPVPAGDARKPARCTGLAGTVQDRQGPVGRGVEAEPRYGGARGAWGLARKKTARESLAGGLEWRRRESNYLAC